MHACIRIGDSPVMLVDEFPEMCGCIGPKATGGTPVTLHLYVDDVDSFAAHAVEAGAKVVVPISDMFWGDRYGVLEDPFGHRWSVATPGPEKSPEEIMAAMEQGGCSAAA
jgi:PhnB protein